jgi:hypothetical protein
MTRDTKTEVRTLAKLTFQVFKEIWAPNQSSVKADDSLTKDPLSKSASTDKKHDAKPKLAPGEGKSTVMRVLRLIEPEVGVRADNVERAYVI